MNVSIKDLSVSMDIKNNGVELDIKDTKNKHLGDLVVTKSGITWCRGKTDRKNGRKMNWNKFIEMMEG